MVRGSTMILSAASTFAAAIADAASRYSSAAKRLSSCFGRQ
jgi:hypothetical protein